MYNYRVSVYYNNSPTIHNLLAHCMYNQACSSATNHLVSCSTYIAPIKKNIESWFFGAIIVWESDDKYYHLNFETACELQLYHLGSKLYSLRLKDIAGLKGAQYY